MQTSYFDLEGFRFRLLEPFRDLPKPADVFDQALPDYEWNDTDLLRGNLLGKDWQELSESNACVLELGILNNDAARYYSQAMIAGRYKEGFPGVDPGENFLVPCGYTERQSQVRVVGYREIYTPMQLDAVAAYVWFYASFHDLDYFDSFHKVWQQFLLPNGVLGTTRGSVVPIDFDDGFEETPVS